MMAIGQRLIETMTLFDVVDPEELGVESRVSQRFPASNNKHRYTLRDRSRHLERATGILTRLGMRVAGDLLVGYVADRFGTEIAITGTGYDRVCLTTMLAGHMEIRRCDGAEQAAIGAAGLVYRGDAGTTFRTSDGNARLAVWIETIRLNRLLAALLDAPLNKPIDFAVAVDWSSGGAASLHGLIAHLLRELERPDCIIANPLALASFTDHFAQTMLLGLPNTFSERLSRPAAAPAPRVVRWAEEHMRARAGEPLLMEEVAAAAGCSLRALQMAFRRFRDTTPHAMLRDIRLDAVRRELAATGGPVSSIARRWGFTNSGRFAAIYAQRFGHLPGSRRD